VSPGPLGDILEGHFRPGFFTGVATVVNILFNLVQPDIAVFGEKDYQQLQVIRRMVSDLGQPVRVLGLATERADDGLALSSRNQYLNVAQRKTAPALYAALCEVAAGLRAGRRDFANLAQESCKTLQQAGFVPQYLDVRQADLSAPGEDSRHFVVLVAAFLGTTRLIDNLSVTIGV